MSVDALALLRIEKLVLPRHATGVEPYVGHHGNASIVSTWRRWDSCAPDELAMILRQQVGPALDAHDDPRGILFFPDVCEFHGSDYLTIARELTDMRGCVWNPKVGADYVPARYTGALAGTHDALVMEMISGMGRDAALEFDAIALTHSLVSLHGSSDVSEYVAQHEAELERAMGSEFVARYTESSKNEAKTEFDRMQAQQAADKELYAHAQRGEPLVSPEEFSAFVDSDAGAAVLKNLDPTILSALEAQFAAIDIDALPDGDLGKALAKALKRGKG